LKVDEGVFNKVTSNLSADANKSNLLASGILGDLKDTITVGQLFKQVLQQPKGQRNTKQM